jgi:hypothetical protein
LTFTRERRKVTKRIDRISIGDGSVVLKSNINPESKKEDRN